jgi:hypothetical protein
MVDSLLLAVYMTPGFCGQFPLWAAIVTNFDGKRAVGYCH